MKIPRCLLALLASFGASSAASSQAGETWATNASREEFTVALIPDTQRYARYNPAMFLSQTHWLKAQRAPLNLKFAIHLGDVVDHNTDREWRAADQAMGVLDGHVPYLVLTGNHDYAYERNTKDQGRMKYASKFNAVFPPLRFRDQPWYGGHKGVTNENSYGFFSAAGRDFMILALEFGPTDDVLEWAGKLVRAHADKWVIVATHCFMYHDDTRLGPGDEFSPHKLDSGYNDGEQIWEKFVRHHHNIFLVVSGHVKGDGAGRLSSKGEHGNVVHQLLSNYQMLPSGGDGWLRILKFRPGEKKLEVRTYSPWLEKFDPDLQQSFDLELDPDF
jgi:hypothetical protein